MTILEDLQRAAEMFKDPVITGIEMNEERAQWLRENAARPAGRGKSEFGSYGFLGDLFGVPIQIDPDTPSNFLKIRRSDGTRELVMLK